MKEGDFMIVNEANLPESDVQKLEKALKATLKKAEEIFGVGIPIVKEMRIVESMGLTLGRAYSRDLMIQLSAEAYKNNKTNMIKDTIPHEVAHLVCFLTGLGRGHDRGWKRVCSALGGNPRSTANVKVSRKRKTKQHEFLLPDGTKIWIGSVRKNRILKGFTGYVHNPTNQRILPEHYTGKEKALK